jgi:hypothetical protein
MFKCLCVMLVLMNVGVPASAEGHEKRPWEWTVQERLKVRFDRDHIRARQLAYEADYPASRAPRHRAESQSAGSERAPANLLSYTIDGRRNPELFLPYELFDSLLSGFAADAELRRKQRGLLRHGIRSFGYDDAEFWSRLEALAAASIAFRQEGPPRRLQLEDADERTCIRYKALQAARLEFARFDEFLYTVIAPHTSMGVATSEENAVALLRRAEEGAGCWRCASFPAISNQ